MMDDLRFAREARDIRRTRADDTHVARARDVSPRTVVIVGGGFMGIAAAAAFARVGRRVLVLEARAGTDPRFRGELIHPHGCAVLDALNLLAPLVRAGASPVRGFAVHDATSHRTIELPYDHTREGIAMDHRAMVATLRREVAQRPGVEIRTAQRVTDVARNRGRVCGVQIAGSSDALGDLVVVADGRHSRLRERLGIETHARLVSFTAAPLVSDAELSSPALGHVFLGGAGPLLAYSVGGRSVRICVDLPRDAERAAPAMQQMLRDGYAPFVPEPLRTAMLRTWRDSPPEISANQEIYTDRCIAPGIALIGDAGGCSHPMTATGITSGLNDVQTLARAVRDDADIDSALERYQRERYTFVRTREILADGLYDFFLGAERSTRAIRDGIFHYWLASGRARSASMALLSGSDSRLGTLWMEYVRLFGHTTWCALRAMRADATVTDRFELFLDLSEKSAEKLGRMVRAKYRTMHY